MGIASRLAALFDRRGAAPLAALLLLGFADALSNIVGHTGLFAIDSASSPLPINGKVPFEAGLLAMSLAAVAGGRLFARHLSAYNLACVLALIAGVAVSQSLPASASAAQGIAGLAVFGIGFIGAKFFGFYLLYLAGNLKTVVMCIAFEKLLKTAVASLVFLMDPAWQEACALVLTAALALCLALACPWAIRQASPNRPEADAVLAQAPSKRAALRSMTGQAALASVVLGITQSFTPYGTYGTAPVQDAEHFAVYLAVASLVPVVAWLVFVRGKRRAEERYRSAFLLVLGGLFVVSTQSGATWTLAPFVAALLLDFLEMFGHVVFDATVFPVWWARPGKTLAPIGAFMAVFSVAALVWIVAVQQAYTFAMLLALVAAYAGTVAVSKLLPRALETASGRRELVDDNYLHDVAEKHGLSTRETDVFLLLAQGRSRSYIQERLSISEGTVKTHTSRIYQKLGVSGKQEMLSFVLDEGETETTGRDQ